MTEVAVPVKRTRSKASVDAAVAARAKTKAEGKPYYFFYSGTDEAGEPVKFSFPDTSKVHSVEFVAVTSEAAKALSIQSENPMWSMGVVNITTEGATKLFGKVID